MSTAYQGLATVGQLESEFRLGIIGLVCVVSIFVAIYLIITHWHNPNGIRNLGWLILVINLIILGGLFLNYWLTQTFPTVAAVEGLGVITHAL